jgi:hypothetical protein
MNRLNKLNYVIVRKRIGYVTRGIISNLKMVLASGKDRSKSLILHYYVKIG